jgi:hypothetical protein
MRTALLALVAVAAWGQAPQGDPQQPRYQPNWPCTGKERSFDPVYAKIAEASGGHLFLFDKSEIDGMSTLAIGDMNHKETVVRAAGKLESFVDIRIPVDDSVESLFVVASLQCMQTILLYDPLNTGVHPEDNGGEDHWFRAGRIAVIPKPQPGIWTLRLAGTGPYFASAQVRAKLGLHSVQLTGEQEKAVSLRLDPSTRDPEFSLIDPEGETIQTLTLNPDPNSPGHYQGTFVPRAAAFRIAVESGDSFQRVDPRLFEAKPVQ